MSKEFKMQGLCFKGESTTTFTEDTAPHWLCKGGRKGSTMCNRWYWEDHVLTLEVGASIKTDFQKITRTA